MKLFFLWIVLFFVGCEIRNPTSGTDSTFGGDGSITTDFGGSQDYAYAVALQEDNKVVAVGASLVSGFYQIAVARYLEDGSLDTGFSGDGKLLVSLIASAHAKAFSVAVQPDGKLVLAGSLQQGALTQFAVVRLTTIGGLDASFGTGGVTYLSFTGSQDEAREVFVQSDGKLVVVGSANNGTTSQFAAARLNADGSLDTTFDSDGKKLVSATSGVDKAYTGALLSDERILIGGTSLESGVLYFSAVRLSSTGVVETGFGVNGTAKVSLQTDTGVVGGMTVTDAGKILMTGHRGDAELKVACFTSDGAVDSNFNSGAVLSSDLEDSTQIRAHAIGVAGSGDAFIVGASNRAEPLAGDVDTQMDFTFLRLKLNGELNQTFGERGRVTLDFDKSRDEAFAMAFDGQDRVVAVGTAFRESFDFAVVRYHSR